MSEWKEIHLPCPDCGSSDALAIREDASSYCFSCAKNTNADKRDKPEPKKSFSSIEHQLATGSYKGITERCITAETAGRYRALLLNDRMLFGYYAEGNTKPIAAKVRLHDKSFFSVGQWKEAGLYGQQLFSTGGKYVTLVEGEYDALAAYQMLGSKWPVVSIKNGASGALKDCQASFEWLDGFDEIVIAFDNDQPGQEAAKEVAALFGGKSKIVKLEEKDACDYLKKGKKELFTGHWWAAEQYVPDGIVSGASLWNDLNKPLQPADAFYPFEALNKLTFGIRAGELTTVCAGSGLGKSQFMKEIVYSLLNKTEDNIGLLFLEEGTVKTGKSIMSLAANKPLHLPTIESTEEERRKAFDATLGTGRIFLFNHFGSTSVDNIVSRVRYLAKALECKYVFLDHVSIVVSAQDNGDERKALDSIMTRLRQLVEETGIALFLVSHLRRPDNKGHEEGSVTSLSQLRGSGSIGQLSDMVLGLERNGQADDITERNTTIVRVLKNRFCGLTGKAGRLLYTLNDGRMRETAEEAL